jgi:3,4-dihydroxy 2-butanone 4-phosphate synthase
MLQRALKDLASGKPVLLYDLDGREAETDMVTSGRSITPERVYSLRKDAGGLICVSIPYSVASKLGLPYLHDLFRESRSRTLRELSSYNSPYGGYPAFSVTVNHIDTYTGITDQDRSKTISELSKIVDQASGNDGNWAEEFGKRFRSPGHVHLLIGGDLSQRQGHTELSLRMAQMAGIEQAMVVCEMLDGKTGRALSKDAAAEYAKSHGLEFIEAGEIMGVVD